MFITSTGLATVLASVLALPTGTASSLAATSSFAVTSSLAATSSFAVRADKVWVGESRVLERATVVIENGRVSAIEVDGSHPDGMQFIEHKGSLTAGMIALHGYPGALGETVDATRTLMPDGRVAYAYDPSHSDYERARGAGITSLVLTPTRWRVCAGTSAVVKAAGRVVVSPEAHLALSFAPDALDPEREPTSLGGAIAMLDAAFQKPSGAFERAAKGSLPVLFEVSSRPDVLRALDFATRHKLSGALHGAALAGELASEIRAAKLAVIVPALSLGEERRNLLAVRALAKEGVPFGFALETPWNHPAALRLAAAMCVREGLDAKVAWDALTSSAARIAGVGERLGRIERGYDADLVLWSGDPLDLSSSVVAVYVDGARVAGGAQ